MNPRILEDGDVVVRRLLGLAVEPQEWGDLLHVRSFAFRSIVCSGRRGFRFRKRLTPGRKLVEAGVPTLDLWVAAER